MLSLIYLIVSTVSEGFTLFPWLPLAVDALNTIFFLIGGIALAADLKVHSCSNQVRFARERHSRDSLLIQPRDTSKPTVLQMAQVILKSDVTKRKQFALSSGSVLQHIWHLSFSLS